MLTRPIRGSRRHWSSPPIPEGEPNLAPPILARTSVPGHVYRLPILVIRWRTMTKLTIKGQVTIPKRLRDHLGLKPGSDIDFELTDDGRVFLKTQEEAPQSRFARLRGSAKLGMTTDELMALTRGEDAD